MTYPQYPPTAGGYPMPPQPSYPPGYGQYPAAPAGYPQPSYPQAPMPPQIAPPASYPPAQAAPAQSAQGAGIPTPPPPMPELRDGGTNGGGAASPKMRHLVGRTIIVIPKRIDDTKRNTIVGSANFGQPQPEAYFDLVVVDGGPLQYGDNQSRNPAEQRPNTHEIDTPCVFRNANDYGFGFVQAVREALDAGEAGRVGVVQQGTRGNFPYLITKCGVDVEGNARPDGDARFAAAMDLFGKLWRDQHAAPGAPREFVNPTPRSLVAPAATHPGAAPAPQVNYGTHPAGTPSGTIPAQYTAPQPAYAQPSPYPPGYGQYPGAPTAVNPALPQIVREALDAMAAQVPPHVEAWLATLDPATAAQQREAFLANAAAQAAPAGPGM